MPYLEAALANGQKARPLDELLQELAELGLYIEPVLPRFYPVPLQVVAQPFRMRTCSNPSAAEPQPHQRRPNPFNTTRLALRLLLLAQGNRLHCGPRPGGKNTWPMPAERRKRGLKSKSIPEPAYLEAACAPGWPAAWT